MVAAECECLSSFNEYITNDVCLSSEKFLINRTHVEVVNFDSKIIGPFFLKGLCN